MKEFQLKYKCDIQEEHCTQYYTLAMLEKLESAADNSFFWYLSFWRTIFDGLNNIFRLLDDGTLYLTLETIDEVI